MRRGFRIVLRDEPWQQYLNGSLGPYTAGSGAAPEELVLVIHRKVKIRTLQIPKHAAPSRCNSPGHPPITARLKPCLDALRAEGKAGPSPSLGMTILGANQSDFARLAGGTIPFIRKYSTICP